MNQIIINGRESVFEIEKILSTAHVKKILIVCGNSMKLLPINDYFDKISVPYVKFSNFSPNPLYEDVCLGVDLFNREKCDTIIAVGGGSAIDVAKCIKLFSIMDTRENYLKQKYIDSRIPLIAIPTTAGTGSESTRFAVIYYQGQKQSVTHESIIPNFAILDSTLLMSLPLYQKKCAMLDALCQGIESWWSVNSTEESREYSKKAVSSIVGYMDDYIFKSSKKAADKILTAANYAGRAINITQTTAPHAMSYKLTSMFNLPHGHAVSVCLPYVWRYMILNPHGTIDTRGVEYLFDAFEKISNLIGAKSLEDSFDKFIEILEKLEIHVPTTDKMSDIDILTDSVNIERLSNNPVILSKEALHQIYSEILTKK